MNPHTVVIKKYGNRRLYDTTNSRYINLDEVAQMVRDGREIQVVDAVSGEDLTRTVLTQIVVEQSKGNDSAFPLDVLRQMIAASGKATNEATLTYMRAVSDLYQNAYRTVAPIIPAPDFASRASQPPAPPAAPEPAVDVDALLERLDELESVVSRIQTPRAPKPASKKRR
ncbi:MAG: polyhydroxyalkanoate synthesis regulator DNA-binding domain-containing protein [Vicinamibacterales bacterium]